MISLVIPIYNEEILIDLLFQRCMAAMKKITEDFEIICVDDGSKDQSLNKLINFHKSDNRFKVISLSRNFGHQSAIFAGLNNCKGNIIAIIDGDLQDPPELLKEFYKKINEGYDVVYAIRKKRKEGIFKKFAYWLYYRLLESVSNVKIPLDSGDFSMFRRIVLDEMLKMPEQSLFLRGIRSWIGFRQTGIAYERETRAAGEPKYSFRQLLQLAYNGLFSFSTFPVKIMTRLGMTVIIFSIIYIIILLIKRIFFGGVPEGFTTLIVVIILFSGVQLIALGLIGEYVLRIYDESRKRPLFIIKEKFL